jgi:hypothetical protein
MQAVGEQPIDGWSWVEVRPSSDGNPGHYELSNGTVSFTGSSASKAVDKAASYEADRASRKVDT